jgi:hypothetical protein
MTTVPAATRHRLRAGRTAAISDSIPPAAQAAAHQPRDEAVVTDASNAPL